MRLVLTGGGGAGDAFFPILLHDPNPLPLYAPRSFLRHLAPGLRVARPGRLHPRPDHDGPTGSTASTFGSIKGDGTGQTIAIVDAWP